MGSTSHPLRQKSEQERAIGGGGGIRTHGPRERTPVFKSEEIQLSATLANERQQSGQALCPQSTLEDCWRARLIVDVRCTQNCTSGRPGTRLPFDPFDLQTAPDADNSAGSDAERFQVEVARRLRSA